MKVELHVVAETDKVVLANLLQLYLYDFSEFRGDELTPHGSFVYPYLDHYFVEEDREACLVTADGHLAGFTMTRRLDDAVRQVAEFFVVRRHRRHGIGQTAAHQMFRRHPGAWALTYDHANQPAARFWHNVTHTVADGPVSQHDHSSSEAASPPGTTLHFRFR